MAVDKRRGDSKAKAVFEGELTREQRRPGRPRLALALGGGAARGLAHIGVLEVLEDEGIDPDCIAGSSMGGLIGALTAAGMNASEIREIARDFHFPSRFIPGGLLSWDSIFPSAVGPLAIDFEELPVPLALTAVDLEAGAQVVLREGAVLPAVRATCSIPGVMPPVELGKQFLVDGGMLNVLPVDVAWLFDADIVVAVQVGGPTARQIPELRWNTTKWLSRFGRLLPNPATAKVSFELLLRTAEIMLMRQMELAAAMTDPEFLIEPQLEDVGLRDFDRLDDAIEAGRRAARSVLPDLVRALAEPGTKHRRGRRPSVVIDPVCSMIVNAARSRATCVVDGETFYFCSQNCADCFERNPERYLRRVSIGVRPT